MVLTCCAVSHHCGEKRLDRTENGYGERRRHKALDCFIIKLRCHRLRHWEAVSKLRELGSDGSELHTGEFSKKHRCKGTDYKSDKRTRHLLGHLAPAEAYHKAGHTHGKFHPIDIRKILEITYPLRNEACRNFQIKRKSEEILHLRREDRKGDTAGESYHDRIRYELEYGSHPAETHDDKKDSCHYGSNDKTLHSVL